MLCELFSISWQLFSREWEIGALALFKVQVKIAAFLIFEGGSDMYFSVSEFISVENSYS